MADTIKFSTLFPLIRIEVPECPDILIEDAVRRAAIEFCERTTFWRETIDDIYTTGTLSEYDIDTPYDTSLVEIIWATYDGKSLASKTESQILEYTSGQTAYYSLLNPRVLKLAPQPQGGVVRIRAALKPKTTANKIRDYVYEEWSEAFYHGALERLLMMSGKPWGNPQDALYHSGQFQEAVADATSTAQSNTANVTYTVQYGGI